MKKGKMSILCRSEWNSCRGATIFLFELVLCSGLALASQLDPNPIRDTQSKVVAVTEENIKDEGKAGAPAPTFRLVHDSGKFLVKDPLEEVMEEKEKALPAWQESMGVEWYGSEAEAFYPEEEIPWEESDAVENEEFLKDDNPFVHNDIRQDSNTAVP